MGFLAIILFGIGIYVMVSSINSATGFNSLLEDSLGPQKHEGTYDFDNCHENLQPFAIVIDVETTGLIHEEGAPTKAKLKDWDEGFPRIVQIAWMTLSREYKAVKKKCYTIKQESPIPKDSIAIHGITDDKAHEEGVDLREVLMEFRTDIEECDYFVGHNVQFDKYVIEAECLRAKLAKPFAGRVKYDTMKMGKSVMGRKFFKLEDFARKTMPQEQFDQLNFHDAMQDVLVTAALFCALHEANVKY